MKIDQDIMELDLDPIAYKVCRDEGWPLHDVDTAVLEYRAFLQVVRDAEPDFFAAPTRAIDIVWHHHILDTQKYFADTEMLFGRYLHHYPYSGVFGDNDAEQQSARGDETRIRMSRVLMPQ